MRLSTIILLLLITLLQLSVKANDSVLINRLITDIAKMQYAEEGKYNFHKGMFYSYKKWAGNPQRTTPDNNIFYTAITAFALRNMLPWLNEKNKRVCNAIIAKASAAYPYYRNKRQLPSYFFGETGKPIMPNTYFIHYLSKLLANPEDIDDSVMILMTDNTDDSTVRKLKLMMDSVSNGQLRTIRNTYKKYRNIPAHSTYLGHKWGVDFDFSVHCNVLYFLLDKKIPFNKYDSATLGLITNMVANREYIKDPKYISPYYATSPILIYHLARLMGQFNIPGLEQYKTQIINDLRTLLPNTKNIMEDIIISTSLMRLGSETESLTVNIDEFEKSNQDQFSFYRALTGSQVRNPFKRLLLNFSLINYHFFCPAYNKVLLLEYLVERNKKRGLKRED